MAKAKTQAIGQIRAKNYRDTVGTHIDNATYLKNNPPGNFRPEINLFCRGYEWASAGNELYDAPIELVGFDIKNASDIDLKRSKFVAGYNKFLRELNVLNDFFLDGVRAYYEGIDWESIPEKKRENDVFVEGYNYAADYTLIEGGCFPSEDFDDFSMYLYGISWANNGMPIEEAPENIRYTTPFVNGYEETISNNSKKIGRR